MLRALLKGVVMLRSFGIWFPGVSSNSTVHVSGCFVISQAVLFAAIGHNGISELIKTRTMYQDPQGRGALWRPSLGT